MNIHIRSMVEHEQMRSHLASEMQKLPLGLPAACDDFRSASFTGSRHGLGIVPHINEQQFVVSNGCENAWVRFDKADLRTYAHNLDKIPIFEDGKGILFPVTHLWVDYNFPTADCAFEWFCGRQCVAR